MIDNKSLMNINKAVYYLIRQNPLQQYFDAITERGEESG